MEREFPAHWVASTRAEQAIANKLEAVGLANAEMVRSATTLTRTARQPC